MSLINWRKNSKNYPGSALAEWAEDFFKDDDVFFNRRWKRDELIPAVNVQEDDRSFNLEVAAPGMKKEDFKIEVENGVLVISASSKSEKEESKNNYTRKEFDYKSFTRSFWLPENIDIDSIKANYQKGILEISMPKVKVEKEELGKVIAVN